jgi:hypothetical protein
MSRRARLGIATLIVVAVLLAAGWWLLGPVSAPEGVTMSDLGSVEDLKARFNADKGHTRLILILSPT